MIIREFNLNDLDGMIAIWNEIVEKGISFPQETLLDSKSGLEFFSSQSSQRVPRPRL